MTTNEERSSALTVVAESSEHPSIIRAASSKDVALAISEYQRIQSALDKALPDCIMQIQGKSFRKKNYWRAVATAFNLQVEEIKDSEKLVLDEDSRVVSVGVTYRATAANGRSATGDGSCERYEKTVYKKENRGGRWVSVYDDEGRPVVDTYRSEQNQTLHNIRSHAHTRAYNRAVSNLVGFGEVSADEINLGEGAEESRSPSRRGNPQPSASSPSSSAEEMFGRQEQRHDMGAATEGEPIWLDEKLGFGKHAERTWRDFLTAKGEGVNYLEWLAQKAKDEKTRIRANTVLDLRGV